MPRHAHVAKLEGVEVTSPETRSVEERGICQSELSETKEYNMAKHGESNRNHETTTPL